jgi:hypothetical protein
MKYKRVFLLLALAALLGTLLGGGALAQTSPNYNLEWNVVAGGGHAAGSANYVVQSTLGQAASGETDLSSNNYVISGGFWGVSGSAWHSVYLPVVLINHP